MKKLLKLAEEYIRGMSVWDMALLKVCLYTAGILMGLAVPRTCRKKAAFVSVGAFTVTYLLVMVPFLNMLHENKG